MALRGIIFDLDGVIVDTVPAHYAAWHRVFTEEGYAFDEDIYHDKVDGRRRQDGAEAVMTGAGTERIQAAAARKDAYFLEQIEKGEFEVFEGSLDFLKRCKAAGYSLATASSSRNVRLVLEKAGVLDLFDAIVGGDDVVRGKPDPSIFMTAAALMGLDAATCVVIEDATSGVRAAKAGGFFCIGVDRGNQPSRLLGADILVRDLSRLQLADLADAFVEARRRLVAYY